MLNLVYPNEGRIYTEGVAEQGAEEDIWTWEGGSDSFTKLHIRSFTICKHYQTLLEWANPGGYNEWDK